MILSRAKNKIANLTKELRYRNGLFLEDALMSYPNFILMYYGIDIKGKNPYNSRHTGVRDFETQLKFLKKNFHIITVKDYFEEKFIAGKPNIAITFVMDI